MVIKDFLSNMFVETLEQAIDSVVVINSRNEVIFYNRAAEKLWGYSRLEVIGENVRILVPQEIKKDHDSYVNKNRETGENKIVGTDRVVKICCKDGAVKWGSMSISKVNVANEVLYTSFIKDVTESVIEKKHLKMLSMVTDSTDNAIIITDVFWNTGYVNKAFTKIFGYKKEYILGKNPVYILKPNTNKYTSEESRNLLKSGKSIKQDVLLQSSDDHMLWCSVVSNPIFDELGEFTNVVTILSEITNVKIHEVFNSKILASIAKGEPLEQIMASACHEIASLVKDVIPAIFKVNDNKLQLLASPKLPLKYKNILHNLDIGENKASSATAAYRGSNVLVTDIDKDPIWEGYRDAILPFGIKSCCSFPIKGSENKTIGVISLYRKNKKKPSSLDYHLIDTLSPSCALAIDREKQQESINSLAYYDSLTKLPNRSMLHAEADYALREVVKIQGDLAVLFIDLDSFKKTNDLLGHLSGDQLLIEVASRINSKCKGLDICGRLSGDEFLVVISGKKSEELNKFIEELKFTISQPFYIFGKRVVPSVSIGVSVFPDDGHDINTLIHRADLAMYEAKKSGNGHFSFFCHKLNELALKRQELEAELKKSIFNNELELHYQPQVFMKSKSLYGVEALARWNHPDFGFVSPGKFISLAEDCGLIEDLSRWALKTACRQMAIWKTKNINVPTISVNLSSLNFHDSGLCEFIEKELQLNGLKPSELTLELTESLLLDTNPKIMKVVNEIHNKGIGFSIDDFGTGYSCLSYLRKLPIKELKLDRSFVSKLEHDETSQALSRAVLQIGESLKLKVVAEGIESNEQYHILKKQGYHVAQGFLFSKPLSAIELEKWIKCQDVERI